MLGTVSRSQKSMQDRMGEALLPRPFGVDSGTLNYESGGDE